MGEPIDGDGGIGALRPCRPHSTAAAARRERRRHGASDLLEEDDAGLALVAEPCLADPQGLLQLGGRAGEVLLDRDACSGWPDGSALV
jgi:hypothetical protein